MVNTDKFYSKILLFGEYSVLLGSMALSIPYSHFQGELSFIHEDKYTDLDFARNSNALLGELHQYLVKNSAKNGISGRLNLEKLESDVRHGLYFESSIPQSYGIGSSGALCAAIYSRYTTELIPPSGSITQVDIKELRHIFSGIESFFHGKSSGIDPLSCYMRYPLLIQKDGEIDLVGIPRNRDDRESGIFLLDSGTSGKTGPLVESFLKHFVPNGVLSNLGQELIRLNDACIQNMVSGEYLLFWKHLKELSTFQLEHLRAMIPAHLVPAWEQGLTSDTYYLKLCGSGGGGFLTGFAKSFTEVSKEISAQRFSHFPVYLSGLSSER